MYSSYFVTHDGKDELVLHEPPFTLRMPKKFRVWRGPTKTHAGINFITYYPSFTSGSDPENKPYLFGIGLFKGCSGWCNGRLWISIENVRQTPKTIYRANYADLMGTIRGYRNQLKHGLKAFDAAKHNYGDPVEGGEKTLYLVRPGPMHGFDEVYYIVDKEDISKSHSQTDLLEATHELYFSHTATDGKKYDLFAECIKNNAYPNCEIYFSLRCNPDIGVEVVGWPWDRIDQSFKLQRRVDQFISGMVVAPRCDITEGAQ